MMPLVFVAMAGLLALGVPIAFTLGLASAIFYVLAPGVTPAFLVQRMVASTESFPLLAVPFFIFAGAVMTRGGISHRIIGLADALVGHRIGGLAQGTCSTACSSAVCRAPATPTPPSTPRRSCR